MKKYKKYQMNSTRVIESDGYVNRLHIYKGGGERFIIFGYDPDTKVKIWIHEGLINVFTLQPERYTTKIFDDGIGFIVPISKVKEEWWTKKMKEKFDKWKVSNE